MGINELINANVQCGICGAKGYVTCDCWVKCAGCGWLFERGRACSNAGCGGDGVLSATHRSPPRTRKGVRR